MMQRAFDVESVMDVGMELRGPAVDVSPQSCMRDGPGDTKLGNSTELNVQQGYRLKN